MEEEREENIWKVEQYEELKAKNGRKHHSINLFRALTAPPAGGQRKSTCLVAV